MVDPKREQQEPWSVFMVEFTLNKIENIAGGIVKWMILGSLSAKTRVFSA